MFAMNFNLRKSAIRLMALAMLVTVLCAAAAGQDSFGYTATSSVPYSYINIAPSGTAVLASTDDGTAVLTLPFSFRFYGTTYTSLCVSTNGLIAFNGCPVGDMTNLDLTSQSPAGNLPLIAPFWMDLSFAIPGAGAVVYQTMGAAPSRQFVIQWNNAYGLNAPGALNFQAILSETADTILFQYQSVESADTAVSKGAGATVGIRAASGDVNNYRYQWSYRAPVLTNSLAIQFTPPASVPAVEVPAIKATTSAFVYNRLTKIYSGTITITNIGKTSLARPLTVVLTNLSAGVTALNPSGTVAAGPYYAVPGTGALAPGGSAKVGVSFTNPSNAKISFVVKTYSGNF